MTPQLEIQIIAVMVAVACSLPGVFLVLRKMSMMSDAITHTILLGIVIAFFITHSLTSPLLIVGAALVGVLTVFLTEMLNSTKLVSEDSAIGIVFPLLFSIAIIMISKYAGSVHLDTDSVLLGELAFAPFNRMKIGGMDIGAKGMYSMGAILIINLIFIIVFFKELKVVTFDPALAAVLGFAPALLHYSLMTIVSITAVGAFEAVGSILVIAFMIGPPVTAYLLTNDLKKMIILSALIGAINAILGYQFAQRLDVSIAGSMAVLTGITFLLVFIFAKDTGLLTIIRRRKSQKIEFAEKSMLFHLYNHEGEENEKRECGVNSIHEHLHWEQGFLKSIIKGLKEQDKIFIEDDIIKLTDEGRSYAIMSYKEIA
ncbi:metal ABC transporter permease [Clostridium algidicarnis]|uniref:Metal ABC transporter permease n=1 Tax=Clostridium algidicarnis TaxID=37659 RepID=A0ABS6C4W9_9CLOT|nr:metal ABC transporter permease [Clostridium algidicarnis]MBB6632085.1 metal ABC transporter permease [Clostridium algidicarnis]MBB6698400.1 metal ABC transporter permease [Clostridium algidicarnis]MBU3193744.1 metal ABC transporter permease [Clostridium algidicarnis]MBU3220530.1 metal ABC transporter permease [Clostridium algidicarnis]